MPAFRMLVLVVSLGLIAACSAKSNTGSGISVVSISVNYVGHKLDPPQSLYEVSKGKDVRIVLSSTTADELYVHGYDKKVAVQSGYPATLEFVADKTGRFDVELRQSHVKLFQVRVS
jgi:hypothetical protein